mgnify:CR=1 FL=1
MLSLSNQDINALDTWEGRATKNGIDFFNTIVLLCLKYTPQVHLLHLVKSAGLGASNFLKKFFEKIGN